ncbi:hypothetical protein OCK74_03750 [Chitinophagaceae bacterium LB-8]|uniref:TonB C-terminal domain-containing protein n=1 Tax=Paraflavisolibacter caeni TaxID=2982496 RepID=A0A9X3B6L2_9BACT|nr:hypothetical protein [Paraflavisolibacter caeni]MCU7548210.1 hypothetical protein [Paraflavisolibacter caeni]
MKKGILLLLLVSSVFVQAQSLKEALFSGKLKNRPGTVVRKGDDLNAITDTVQKIDTVHNLVANDSSKILTAPTVDSSTNKLANKTDSAAITPMANKNNNPTPTVPDATGVDAAPGIVAAPVVADAATEKAAAPKNNNVLWKEYIDTVSSTIKTEVLPSKKVKKETYYVTVSYTIGTDGQVDITDVAVSPENSFLKDNIKSRLIQDAPKLNPVLSSTGAPRKVSKRHNFTLTKE